MFRVALTGDFLNTDGQPAYPDYDTVGIPLLETTPAIAYHYLRDQSPQQGGADYWEQLYSLRVLPHHLCDIDGLIVLRPYVGADAFASGAETLTVIARSGAGYDKIDLAACTQHDVAVFNVPNVLDHSTASTALMFMLALAKRLLEQERVSRSGRWERQAAVTGHELTRRTLGIIGLGASGRELVRLAAPFDMRVIAYSPHADPAQAAALGVDLVPLDEVMRESDFISVHASLTAEKHHMLGAAQFALMKPTAYFINVARGALVDQAALTTVLQERRIGGAALDVYEVEPLPADDPLVALDNVILTPHYSPATRDIWAATARVTCHGMVLAAQGIVPPNIVNTAVLEQAGFQKKLARFAENGARRHE